MPESKDKMTIEVSFLADKETDRKLCQMVDAYEGSKSALLRRLVNNAYAMRVDQRPMCANAEACRAPQLFMSFGIPPAPAAGERPDPDTNRLLATRDGT